MLLPAGRILVPGRMPTAQQHIQQYSQGVHVGGYGDGSAQYLFGRRVIGGENPEALVREIRLRIRLPPRLPISFAMPKSSSFTIPSSVTWIFDGLMSRCTIKFECACPTAVSTSRNSFSRASTPKLHSSQWRSMALPFTYSNTRYGWPASDHTRVHYSRDVRVRESGQYATLTPEAPSFTVAGQ